MDLLLLPAIVLFLGSIVSIFSIPFRKYWLFALAFTTFGAMAFQIAVFLRLGFLDSFYKVAFVVSWLLLFGFGTLAYLAYRFVVKKKCE